MSYTKISRTPKIFCKCNLVVLQYSLQSWKQELCCSSSILKQCFNFMKYYHFLHVHSKSFYAELLPPYCATETGCSGLGVEIPSLLICKYLAFKIVKWLMQKLSKVIEVLRGSAHSLTHSLFVHINTWEQLWEVSVIHTWYFGPWFGCWKGKYYCDLMFYTYALAGKSGNKSALVRRD